MYSETESNLLYMRVFYYTSTCYYYYYCTQIIINFPIYLGNVFLQELISIQLELDLPKCRFAIKTKVSKFKSTIYSTYPQHLNTLLDFSWDQC